MTHRVNIMYTCNAIQWENIQPLLRVGDKPVIIKDVAASSNHFNVLSASEKNLPCQLFAYADDATNVSVILYIYIYICVCVCVYDTYI